MKNFAHLKLNRKEKEMSDKKVTDEMIERIKHLVKAIENGEYDLSGYEFTINLIRTNGKTITIKDNM